MRRSEDRPPSQHMLLLYTSFLQALAPVEAEIRPEASQR